MFRLIAAASALAMLGGCASLQSGSTANQAVLTGSASDRHVYFMPGRTGHTATAIAICPEPSPDTATERAISAAIEGAGGQLGTDATAEASLEYKTSVVQLAGRTQTVVLARDLMFNACLMRANGYLTDAGLVNIYGQTIQLIRDLGLSDKVQSAANAARAGVASSTISAALAPGNERDRVVTDLAQALLTKPVPDRRIFVDTALACPAGTDGAFCRASADSLMTPSDIGGMQAAVGSLSSEHINALSAALAKGS